MTLLESVFVPRTYIVFLETKIPLWTLLLKLGLWLRQGYQPRFTHVSALIVNSPTELTWVELDWYHKGVSVHTSEVLNVGYDINNNMISILQEHHKGEPSVLNAIDVSSYTSVHAVLTRLLATQLGDVSFDINPLTLLKHLVPGLNHTVWTCTGLVSYLVGVSEYYDAVMNPFNPDELYDELADDSSEV